MANFPTSAPSFTSKSPGQTIASAHINSAQDEIVAIGTVLVNSANYSANALTSIKFPAAQVASADANALDDYEEGTWTPVLNFGGATTGITYATQTGRYTKIGRLVTIEVRLVLTSNGSAAGNATITGCPFSEAVPNIPAAIDPTTGFAGLTAGGAITAVLSAQIIYPMLQTTTSRVQLTDTNITDTAQFSFAMSFSV